MGNQTVREKSGGRRNDEKRMNKQRKIRISIWNLKGLLSMKKLAIADMEVKDDDIILGMN